MPIRIPQVLGLRTGSASHNCWECLGPDPSNDWVAQNVTAKEEMPSYKNTDVVGLLTEGFDAASDGNIVELQRDAAGSV